MYLETPLRWQDEPSLDPQGYFPHATCSAEPSLQQREYLNCASHLPLRICRFKQHLLPGCIANT